MSIHLKSTPWVASLKHIITLCGYVVSVIVSSVSVMGGNRGSDVIESFQSAPYTLQLSDRLELSCFVWLQSLTLTTCFFKIYFLNLCTWEVVVIINSFHVQLVSWWLCLSNWLIKGVFPSDYKSLNSVNTVDAFLRIFNGITPMCKSLEAPHISNIQKYFFSKDIPNLLFGCWLLFHPFCQDDLALFQ